MILIVYIALGVLLAIAIAPWLNFDPNYGMSPPTATQQAMWKAERAAFEQWRADNCPDTEWDLAYMEYYSSSARRR
jgi:hypothetical protein